MKMLGNLLLVLGTILGGIAAANSKRPWRWLAVTGPAPGQYLFEDARAPGAAPDAPPVAAAGSELDERTAAALRAAGIERVQVKDPPRDSEPVAITNGALEDVVGRVLAEDVTLGTRRDQIPKGRRFTAALAAEMQVAGVGTARVNAAGAELQIPVALFLGWTGTQPEELLGTARAALASPDLSLEELETLVGGKARLAEELDLALPDVRKAGAFVDESLARDLAQAGLDSVAVRVPREFRWSDWSWKWGFLGALALMALGIAAKKSEGPAPAPARGAQPSETPTATPRELLAALETKVRELAERADELDAEAIHRAVDPLLIGECYVLAAGRDALRAALGGARFAEVFGPFSTAERRLNRAWSAAVDGHAQEARDSIQSAAPELTRALAALPD